MVMHLPARETRMSSLVVEDRFFERRCNFGPPQCHENRRRSRPKRKYDPAPADLPLEDRWSASSQMSSIVPPTLLNALAARFADRQTQRASGSSDAGCGRRRRGRSLSPTRSPIRTWEAGQAYHSPAAPRRLHRPA